MSYYAIIRFGAERGRVLITTSSACGIQKIAAKVSYFFECLFFCIVILTSLHKERRSLCGDSKGTAEVDFVGRRAI